MFYHKDLTCNYRKMVSYHFLKLLFFTSALGLIVYLLIHLFIKIDSSKLFLDGSIQTIMLLKKTHISHDTIQFRFKLPLNTVLGLPVGKHIVLFAKTIGGIIPGEWNGHPDKEASTSQIQRKYTPITLDCNAVGFFELLIKIYKKSDNFPDGGRMSQYLENLQVGETIKVKGPVGVHGYYGKGMTSSYECNALIMIAGGSGITPLFQIIQSILKSRHDDTSIRLLYANKTENDILLRKQLDELARQQPSQFQIWYTLDFPPPGWKYSTGFVTSEMICNKLIDTSSGEVGYMVCGPLPMVKYACVANLKKLGVSKDKIIIF
jgi:cytochrome-b5 reductase